MPTINVCFQFFPEICFAPLCPAGGYANLVCYETLFAKGRRYASAVR